MPLTVAEIMDTAVPTVRPEDSVESVLRTLHQNELSGIPVVNEGGRCVGIITERDLVMTGENSDLHLPHYFEPVVEHGTLRGMVTRVDVLEALVNA